MDVREKLVELLSANTCKHDCCEDCEYCDDGDACIDYLKNSMADIQYRCENSEKK